MENELIEAVNKIAHIEGVPRSRKLDGLSDLINKMLAFGYTHQVIVNCLNAGGIVISTQVFTNYLGHRKKKSVRYKGQGTDTPLKKSSGGGFRIVRDGKGANLSKFE